MMNTFPSFNLNGRQYFQADALNYMSPVSAFTRRPDYIRWARANSLTACENHLDFPTPNYQLLTHPDARLDKTFPEDCGSEFGGDSIPTLLDLNSTTGENIARLQSACARPPYPPFLQQLDGSSRQQRYQLEPPRDNKQEHQQMDHYEQDEHDEPGTESGKPMSMTEKVSRKTTPHKLPACKVCGSQATGFHYGVNSCEACKGFFHRSLLRNKPYKCFGNSKCQILPGKRNVCGKCRYQRCLDVGMSKEGIKTGRYTYEKRTKDILELQNSTTTSAPSQLDSNPQPVEVVRNSEIEAFVCRLVEEKEKLLSDVQLVDKSHSGITIRHQEAPEKLLYIPYEPPDPNEDGGIQWRKWASVMENTGGVRRVIKFVKTIPGFRELEIADQIQLIKHAFVEIWLVARHKTFDIERARFNNRVGFSFDIIKAFGEDGEMLLKVAKRLKMMELSEEETSLMLALVTFFSDRCQQLINPSKVDAIQDNILGALCYVLSMQHPGDRTRLHNIMSIFVDLRSVTEMYHALSNRLLDNIGDIAPLLWEIVNLS